MLADCTGLKMYGQTGRFHRGGWRRIAIQASVVVIWRTERYVEGKKGSFRAVGSTHNEMVI